MSPCDDGTADASIATSARLTAQLLELVEGLEEFVADVTDEAARRRSDTSTEGPRHA